MGIFKKVHRDPYEDAVDLRNHKSLKDKVWVLEGKYYRATSVSFSTDGRGTHHVRIHTSRSLSLLDTVTGNVVRLGGLGGIWQALHPRPFLLDGRGCRACQIPPRPPRRTTLPVTVSRRDKDLLVCICTWRLPLPSVEKLTEVAR